MKISELPLAQTVSGNDVAAIVQDGTTKKATLEALTAEVLQVADTNAQGYAETAEANAEKTANAAALAAQEAAIASAKAYTDSQGWELWYDQTLEEDTNLIAVYKTSDGRPISVKKCFLLFSGATNQEATISLRYKNGVYYQSWQTFTAKPSGNVGIWYMSERIAPGVFYCLHPNDWLTDWKSNGDQQGLAGGEKGLSSNLAFVPSGGAATNIIFGAHGSFPDFRMLAGSRIQIWGVMAND